MLGGRGFLYMMIRDLGFWLHVFFFFNDTATTEIYTLSLHDALPILKFRRPELTCCRAMLPQSFQNSAKGGPQGNFSLGSKFKSLSKLPDPVANFVYISYLRSEEHTSELQSHVRISYAVFCLKKKNKNKKKKQKIHRK